jgi:hypothetical protein
VRRYTALLTMVVLAAIGFAAASIVGGESASSADTTGTTATTAVPGTTATVTITAPTTQTVVTTVVRTVQRPATVLLCHRTPSGRIKTIKVRLSANALVVRLRHGDLVGRCTAAKIKLIKQKHHRG